MIREQQFEQSCLRFSATGVPGPAKQGITKMFFDNDVRNASILTQDDE